MECINSTPTDINITLIDFFFLKTFSPESDTTLNSIFPENVAVKDLENLANKVTVHHFRKIGGCLDGH